MSTVYVIGAGASYGESLRQLPDLPAGYPELHPHSPPLTNGFFDRNLLNALSYPEAERDFAEIVEYVRTTNLLTENFGEVGWDQLNLEEIFTYLEIEREFQNPESDHGARLLLLRNKLIRYIRRIIGLCTQFMFGHHYRTLVEALGPDDSVISFNWDLLLDQEFLPAGILSQQYSRFFTTVQPPEITVNFRSSGNGLYLKLHGSLNWFRCGNNRCQASVEIDFQPNVQHCLSVSEGIGGLICQKCGSDMNPIIIPPLLRKPVVEDPAIRSAWGLARAKLESASKVVVIGFSAAPTDFYSAWLLKSAVGTRTNVEVIVINPSNKDADKNHDEFTRRMNSIFLRGYGSDLHEFSQINAAVGNGGKVRAS